MDGVVETCVPVVETFVRGPESYCTLVIDKCRYRVAFRVSYAERRPAVPLRPWFAFMAYKTLRVGIRPRFSLERELASLAKLPESAGCLTQKARFKRMVARNS